MTTYFHLFHPPEIVGQENPYPGSQSLQHKQAWQQPPRCLFVRSLPVQKTPLDVRPEGLSLEPSSLRKTPAKPTSSADRRAARTEGRAVRMPCSHEIRPGRKAAAVAAAAAQPRPDSALQASIGSTASLGDGLGQRDGMQNKRAVSHSRLRREWRGGWHGNSYRLPPGHCTGLACLSYTDLGHGGTLPAEEVLTRENPGAEDASSARVGKGLVLFRRLPAFLHVHGRGPTWDETKATRRHRATYFPGGALASNGRGSMSQLCQFRAAKETEKKKKKTLFPGLA